MSRTLGNNGGHATLEERPGSHSNGTKARATRLVRCQRSYKKIPESARGQKKKHRLLFERQYILCQTPQRLLRGGASDLVGRPVRFLLLGNAVRITGGCGKFGRPRLRRKVEGSHCACIAAAGQEHRIEVGRTFKYATRSK